MTTIFYELICDQDRYLNLYELVLFFDIIVVQFDYRQSESQVSHLFAFFCVI
jgi:hypothetical protein